MACQGLQASAAVRKFEQAADVDSEWFGSLDALGAQFFCLAVHCEETDGFGRDVLAKERSSHAPLGSHP
jgi:hypothetical protein